MRIVPIVTPPQKPAFVPYQFTVVVESQDEDDMFAHLSYANERIPYAIDMSSEAYLKSAGHKPTSATAKASVVFLSLLQSRK